MSIGTKLAVFLYHSQVLSGAGHRQKLRKSIGILETFGGNRNLEQTILLITHDEKIALEADRIITIEDGKIISDQKRR